MDDADSSKPFEGAKVISLKDVRNRNNAMIERHGCEAAIKNNVHLISDIMLKSPGKCAMLRLTRVKGNDGVEYFGVDIGAYKKQTGSDNYDDAKVDWTIRDVTFDKAGITLTTVASFFSGRGYIAIYRGFWCVIMNGDFTTAIDPVAASILKQLPSDPFHYRV